MTDLPAHALRKLAAIASEPDDEEGGWRRRFRIVGELGRGGMGVVYEAWDEELGRPVALKVLSLRNSSEPDARERFEREAVTAARLDHPGIAAVYDAWDDAIAMQLVRGITLADPRRPREPRACARVIRDAARAVHFAHDRGIVHRDIKPHNLMLEGERVVVTDFGLAKTAGEASVSATGGILGTPSYMSPEQADGQGRFAGPTTDVWGLGATLYELLTGKPPFLAGHPVEILRLVREVDPPRAGIDQDLDLVVATCLEKDPVRRYGTAAELADDLERWLTQRPIVARPPSVAYRLSKFTRRHRAVLSAAAILVIVSVVAAFLTLQERSRRAAADEGVVLARRVDAILDDFAQERGAGDTVRAGTRLVEGLSACDAFLKRHGETANAHFLRGRLLAAHGRFSEALQAFDLSLALDSDVVAARLARGQLLASDFARRAVESDPPLTVAELVSREPKRARRALEDLQAAVRRPEYFHRVDVFLARAELARLQGDRVVARRGYQEALHLDPLHSAATRSLLRLDLEEGDGDAAWHRAMSAVDVDRGLGRAYALRHRDDLAPPTPELEPLDLGTEASFVSPGPGRHSGDAAAYLERGLAATRRAVERSREGDRVGAELAWSEAVADFETALLLDSELECARIDRDAARIELARVRRALGRDSVSMRLLDDVLSELGPSVVGEHPAATRNRATARKLSER